ncbi:MAG: type II secretion system protein [Chlamydiae bacterium]|nr:type II secretion system protein [Chlamydiota bacterium]
MKNRIQVRKKHPLTLLEIMIVIFLIGLISSVIGFNMKGSLDKAKVFKTEKGIAQIKEILLLEIAKNELSLADISSNDAEANKANAKDCLRRSGMIKNVNETFKDGWGEEYEIMPSSDSLEDFEIVSRKLYAHREKSAQPREESTPTHYTSRDTSFGYSSFSSQNSNNREENGYIQRKEPRYVSLPLNNINKNYKLVPNPHDVSEYISNENPRKLYYAAIAAFKAEVSKHQDDPQFPEQFEFNEYGQRFRAVLEERLSLSQDDMILP